MKVHILPALLVFVIPFVSLGFFKWAVSSTDTEVLNEIKREIAGANTMPQDEKERALDFYTKVKVSQIMASNSPELIKMQSMFEPLAWRYWIFRWMLRISWICLGAIGATFLIVGTSIPFSLRSSSAQYWALRIGWPVIRTSIVIQVLGQGILAVALSFWVTALVFNIYIPKLIVIIAIFVLVGIWALLRAVFTKPNQQFEVWGELVSETQAPTLWKRVRDNAAKLNTAPPERIIMGVDPSFFVTENSVTLAGNTYSGRTLYLSFPLLKILAADEAAAILGHEMAHFSGNDTFWSRKIAPLMGKFQVYLQTLGVGTGIIVAHYVHLFWKIYGLSIHKLSRAREFRADKIGAEVSSTEAMTRALVKVSGYCEYRAKTENSILEEKRVDPTLDLPGRLESGFPSFLTAFTQNGQAVNERLPHPFDTHPTLHNRLESLGLQDEEALSNPGVTRKAFDSWYGEIATAEEMEAQLWKSRQEMLQNYQASNLAWTVLPQDAEEQALVLKYFPQIEFLKKNGEKALLEYDRLKISEYADPILFKNIDGLSGDSGLRGFYLEIMHRSPSTPATSTKTTCYPNLYKSEKGDLLGGLNLYFSRHKAAHNSVLKEFPKAKQVPSHSDNSPES